MKYLPTELLDEIFSLSCGIGESSGFSNIQPEGLSDYVQLPTTPPSSLDGSPILVISAVCKDWRVISLASRRLWSKIEIREELRSASRDRIHALKNLLKFHLARSGEYSLDIVFEFTEFSIRNSSMDWEEDYPWDSDDAESHDGTTQAGKVENGPPVSVPNNDPFVERMVNPSRTMRRPDLFLSIEYLILIPVHTIQVSS
ncbi:hypothetical protein VKT23_012640 [Stygiomarasmius scandens]|uniref:F-box domain-containing protein n=1 Tax=Marasmiellus scandens TaxID=2682957 RepID=A0ABR1J924_9AGAR